MSVFEGFFSAVADLLGWFYSLTHSYGGAIVLLTIVVMIVTAPLTLKSTRSMVQMQRLSPELKRLKEKHKNDREALNQEMMAFYKANDINPLGGCLPMIVQGPVFLVLYRVLRGLIERRGGVGSGLGHIVGQSRGLSSASALTPWKLTDQPFNPEHLSVNSAMYKALTGTTKMGFLGMDLSFSPFQAMKQGVVTALPYVVLMVLMFVFQYIQNRQIQGRSTNAATPAVMKFLPFMLPVVSLSLPTGVGVYYLVQGLFRIGLQHYMTKNVYSPADGQTVVTTATETDSDDADDRVASKKASAKSAPAAGATDVPVARSARSAAVQRKAEQGPRANATRRRSGAPRSGSDRGSGADGPPR